MRIFNKLAAIALMVVVTNCVSLTVNVNFPVTEMRQAAEEIEERVRYGEGVEGLQSFRPTPVERPASLWIALQLGEKEAYAQNVDISIETPAIKKIIASRTKRYKQIEPYMTNGTLGEGLAGFLAIRDTAGIELKTLTEIKKLIKAENDDRDLLYKEILTANNLEANKENMKKVQGLFVEAIRKTMKPGHWYQVKKDAWEQKKKEE